MVDCECGPASAAQRPTTGHEGVGLAPLTGTPTKGEVTTPDHLGIRPSTCSHWTRCFPLATVEPHPGGRLGQEQARCGRLSHARPPLATLLVCTHRNVAAVGPIEGPGDKHIVTFWWPDCRALRTCLRERLQMASILHSTNTFSAWSRSLTQNKCCYQQRATRPVTHDELTWASRRGLTGTCVMHFRENSFASHSAT
jgi:hypothetical protein